MESRRLGVQSARAAYTDTFQYPGATLSPHGPAFIEKNRLTMAAREGLVRKILPLREDETGAYAGGCHLFDTYANALDYKQWCEQDWTLDNGLRFLEQPQFLEPTSQVWQVSGAEDFTDIGTDQQIMRFERWHVNPSVEIVEVAERWWPTVRNAARAHELGSVWLLAGPDEFHPQLGLVTTLGLRGHDSGTVSDEGLPSFSSLELLESPAESLARHLQATKVFDRTSWVYMVWFPIAEGDSSPENALWPCSPPLRGLTLPTE